MSRRPLKTGDGEGFLRAFTDEWGDIEGNHKVEVFCRIARTKRRGVLQVTLVAMAQPEQPLDEQRAKYTVEYPTAAVATFEAALYRAILKLDHILTQQAKWPEGRA